MAPKTIIPPSGYCHYCKTVCGLYGLCHCGCGCKTKISQRNSTRNNYIKNRPIKFIVGHTRLQKRPPIRYGTVKGKPVAYIPLTRGKWAIIDRKQLYRVKQYNFKTDKKGYAATTLPSGQTIKLHQLILGKHATKQIDHRNGNKLDCRELNLRHATDAENKHNRGINCLNKSGYKGVNWNPLRKRWIARIAINGRRIYLLQSRDLIKCAKAYDRAAIEHHGEFAHLNFPNTS